MIAALKESYVEFIIFMGITEKYPLWFERLLEECAYTDESRFTFWVDKDERRPDYYEKKLIEEYSVFLRKPNGELHITTYDSFQNLYVTFKHDTFTNSGLAAFESDCIEYVECTGGMLSVAYPEWFYEYFSEVINLPHHAETILFKGEPTYNISIDGGPFLQIDEYGGVSVETHCVFLRNKFGEIRGMLYEDFKKFYDDDPEDEPIIWG